MLRSMRCQRGFTLIETGVALVIVGLLLGATFKGQELINVARARSLIAFNGEITTAYFAFRDRYRALAGDYNGASANIPNCGNCENGNNDGQILLAGGPDESIAAWEHLSKAGFIAGTYTYRAGDPVGAVNTPANSYGSLVQLIYDTAYQEGGSTTGPARHNLKTGSNVPSNILGEVDRKMDDGKAEAGVFRYSPFGGADSGLNSCFHSHAWNSNRPLSNCGGAYLY
jgi:prepilin-type N-terminal cleavage/methylation domain-containing protein